MPANRLWHQSTGDKIVTDNSSPMPGRTEFTAEAMLILGIAGWVISDPM
jgi:hypothetical protein